MEMLKIPWIVAVAILAMCCVAMAVNIQTQTIANNAHVSTPMGNITAYSDEACTQLLEKIEWGNITEGIEHSKTFWVKNEGDDAVNAEWHDDIEEARTLRYDVSYMEYYNESLHYWRWWSEGYGIFVPINVTPKGNVTPRGIIVPPRGSVPPRPPSDLYLEPGEKVKVRYTIKFEVSPIIAEKCMWDLELGY